MRRLLALAALLALAPVARAEDRVKKAFPDEAREVLEKGDFEVLALVCEREPKAGEETFHGYPVTKKIAVTGEERSKLVLAIYKDVADGEGAAKCFDPHHAVHATKDGKTVDLVICFQCHQIEIHGVKEGWTAIADESHASFAKLLGEKMPAPFVLKYGDKTASEWIAVIEKTGARRYSGALTDEAQLGVGYLGQLFRDERDPLVRAKIARTLWSLGKKAAPSARFVAQALEKAKDDRDRALALNVLEALGPEAEPALPVLEKLLATPDAPLALRTLEAVAAVGTLARGLAPAVVAWSQPANGETNVVQGALALAKIGAGDDATVQALLGRIEGARWNVRRAIIQALGDLRAQAAKPALEKARGDEDAHVRLSARLALAQLAGDPSSMLPDLEKALAHDQEDVLRRFAAADLVRCAGAKAVPLLARLLDGDSDRFVRLAAAEALSSLGPDAKAALPVLEKVAASKTTGSELRALVAEAIDRVRGG